MNTVVPAIDEWAAASACTEPGRLAGVEPGAAALASEDACRGANGGRDVGHGSLIFALTSLGQGAEVLAGAPPLVLAKHGRKRQISRAPPRQKRAPRSRSKFLVDPARKPNARTRSIACLPNTRLLPSSPHRAVRGRAGIIFALRATGCRARALWAGPATAGAQRREKIIAAHRSPSAGQT